MYTALFHSDAAAPARSNLAAIILRVSLALIFVLHGLDKIVNYDVGADWVNQMYGRAPVSTSTNPAGQRTYIPIPTSLTFTGVQLAVAWGEFLGGLALACGMLTRLAALGEIAIQLGAVILVTIPRGFQLRGGGSYEYEYNLALIIMSVAVLILGPGHWSLDRLIAQRRAGKKPAATVSMSAPSAAANVASETPMEQIAPGASR